MSQNKLLFIHYLRGIAAVMVAYFHLVPWYFYKDYKEIEVGVGHNIYTPVISDAAAEQLHFLLPPYANSFGTIGVCIFFLITGFVIPFSIEKQKETVRTFLIRRTFRIYPLHIFTLLASIAVLWFSGYLLYGKPDLFDVDRIWKNFFLMNDLLHVMPFNSVWWTLIIEIKFYLLAALIIAISGRFTPANTLIIIAICLMVMLSVDYMSDNFSTFIDQSYFATLLSHSFAFCYILMGTFFYFLYTKQFTLLQTAFLLIVACSVIAVTEYYIAIPSFTNRACQWAAFVIFLVCYFLSRYIRKSKVLDFLGNISYPLYLIHFPLSLVIMGGIAHATGSVMIALITETVVIFLSAWLLHKYIEDPLNLYGKRLSVLSTQL